MFGRVRNTSLLLTFRAGLFLNLTGASHRKQIEFRDLKALHKLTNKIQENLVFLIFQCLRVDESVPLPASSFHGVLRLMKLKMNGLLNSENKLLFLGFVIF